MQIILTGFVILVLVGQGHSTYMRNFIWRTDESLWLDAVDKAPNLPRVHNNLGRYYVDSNQLDKAFAELNLSLSLPRGPNSINNYLSHYNLALGYLKEDNQKNLALHHLLKTIEIAPFFSDAYNNIAVLKIEEGEFDEAFNLLITALTHNKNSAEAHHNLGFVLLKKGRYDEAYYEFMKALNIKDNYFAAFVNLGIIFKYKGDFPEALDYFQKAIESNTESIIPYLHLLEIYTLENRTNLIDKTARKIIAKFPTKKLTALLIDLQDKSSHAREIPDLDLIKPVLGKILLIKYEAYEILGNKLINGEDL